VLAGSKASCRLAKTSERSKETGGETEENDMEPTRKTIEPPPLSSPPNQAQVASKQHHLDHLWRWQLIQKGDTTEIDMREQQQERGKEQSHRSAEGPRGQAQPITLFICPFLVFFSFFFPPCCYFPICLGMVRHRLTSPYEGP
jgi:hypothetical protein